ncbi:hypothetical protein F5Y14DRAFT_433752 [Nemania sp. NC0429]|nr:hypothetical protein F5Y14DRAFT_433752 [Nemania sp. NC0429]
MLRNYLNLIFLFGPGLALSGGGVSGSAPEPRAVAAPAGPFGLYAYGGGIGGAQVFYSHDVAFIGDQTKMNDDEAALVVFTTGPNNELVGNPDTASSRGVPTWSNKAFFVPKATSSSRRVGFTSRASEPDADADTSGFVFYGATALHEDADHALHGLWSVVPVSAAEEGEAEKRIWALLWNVTDADGARVSVTLRSTPPATPFDLPEA